jgi:diguanylate cyclase (GGDEF)-like protein
MENQLTYLFPNEDQRFLVVDDEESIVSLLKDYLNLLGYPCETASNGREALEKIRQDPSFTIVITDICMPEMDGIELIKRAKEEWPEIDFIAITGYTRRYRYSDVVKAGASDFINKPFDLDELQAKIDRIIRERKLRQQLKAISHYDALTGIFNRRYFEEKVPEECYKAARQGYPLYLVMIDVDRFKEFNDAYGHQAGDELLRKLAETLVHSTRRLIDFPFRYGGDEFALLIPQCDAKEVEKIVKRILKRYQSFDLEPTSLSAGIAVLILRGDSLRESVDDLIRRADEALYEAKREGGGKVIFDQESLPA